MDQCKLNGRLLSVPTIVIDHKTAFIDVPGPEKLRRVIESVMVDGKQTG